MAADERVRLVITKRDDNLPFEERIVGECWDGIHPSIGQAINKFNEVWHESPQYRIFYSGVIQALDGREILTLPIAHPITTDRMKIWREILLGAPKVE